MGPRLGTVLALALLLGGALPTPAPAREDSAGPRAEAHVDAREEYFYPSSVEVRRGGAVVWDWTGEATHTATDETGMGLFDSDLVPPGGPSFTFAFIAAGSYPYVCTLHEGMDGRVEVPIRASVIDGGAMVVWSSDAADAGFMFDVQVRRTGHRWRSWLEGTTEPDATYLASAARLRFRARLRLDVTGASSGWSEARSITVD